MTVASPQSNGLCVVTPDGCTVADSTALQGFCPYLPGSIRPFHCSYSWRSTSSFETSAESSVNRICYS